MHQLQNVEFFSARFCSYSPLCIGHVKGGAKTRALLKRGKYCTCGIASCRAWGGLKSCLCNPSWKNVKTPSTRGEHCRMSIELTCCSNCDVHCWIFHEQNVIMVFILTPCSTCLVKFKIDVQIVLGFERKIPCFHGDITVICLFALFRVSILLKSPIRKFHLRGLLFS